MRAEGPVGHQQRRQSLACQFGKERQAGAGLFCLSHRAVHWNARRRAGRHRCLRVHGRYWRKCPKRARGRAASPRLLRTRARRRRQCRRRAADLAAGIGRCLLCDSDRRGADDRAAHAACAAPACISRAQGETRMIDVASLALLKGKKALVTGIANDQSIAWGCAKAFRAFGADVAVTYLNDKCKPYVEPLAKEIKAPIFMPLDLQREGQLEAVFDKIKTTWDKLDLCLHSIAFAPKQDLQGRVVDCSREGFLLAMQVSCWSFIRMAKLAEPLMKEGGALFTMTYYGSQMVVEHYNIMGPVKAALESATRYLAAELGPKGIRVHAISPGPLKTRAASGITDFDELLQKAQSKAPSRSLVSIDDVGVAVAFLGMNGAKLITGETLYIDGGYHIID